MGFIKASGVCILHVRMSGIFRSFGGSPMFLITRGFTLSLPVTL